MVYESVRATRRSDSGAEVSLDIFIMIIMSYPSQLYEWNRGHELPLKVIAWRNKNACRKIGGSSVLARGTVQPEGSTQTVSNNLLCVCVFLVSALHLG